MTTSTDQAQRHFRPAINVGDSNISDLLTALETALVGQELAPFLVHLDVTPEGEVGWAVKVDDTLLARLAAMGASTPAKDYFAQRPPTPMAWASDITTVDNAKAALLTAGDGTGRTLLLIGDDMTPQSVFTLTVASIKHPIEPGADQLFLSAGLPYSRAEFENRSLIRHQPVLLEVRIDPKEQSAVLAARAIDAARLRNEMVRIEVTGPGLAFGPTRSATAVSPALPVGDGSSAVVHRFDMIATTGAEAHLRVTLRIDDESGHSTAAIGELDVAFAVVESVEEMVIAGATASPTAQLIAAPRPIRIATGEDRGETFIGYTVDGAELRFPMATHPSQFRTARYGEILARLTSEFCRQFPRAPNEVCTDGPLTDGEDRIRTLADIGRDLYEMVFGEDHFHAGRQAREWFQRQEGPLWVADSEPHLLWELFYDGPPPGDAGTSIDELRRGFWGYRFAIEHIVDRGDPMASDRTSTIVFPARCSTFTHREAVASSAWRPGPDAGFTVGDVDALINEANDQLMASPGLTVDSPGSFPESLGFDAHPGADVVYLFGHGTAATALALTNGVPCYDDPESQATLALEPGGPMTLSEIKAVMPTPMRGWPLVFINACETMHTDLTYGNPMVNAVYLKGNARALVGCVAEVPAMFAVHFAQKFFDSFLGGQPLGAAMHLTKRELLERNNPYGLLYTVYGPSNLTVMEVTA